jgi:copper(I)-binding protein
MPQPRVAPSSIHGARLTIAALVLPTGTIAMRLLCPALALLLAATLPTAPGALAADAADLQISGAWARPMPPGARVGAGYVEIRNPGTVPRRLLGADSPRASSMEIHTMAEVDGVMRMRRLRDGIEIPAGASIALKPGAEHLMFFNPAPAFAIGDSVPVTLRFDGEQAVELQFEVVDPASRASGSH